MAMTMLYACQRKAAPATAATTTSVTDRSGNPMLLGVHTKEDMQQAPYADWFNASYNSYTIDSATAGKLKPLLTNKQFEIYMGTWCGDSKREVPRMYKILEYAGVKPSQVKLIMVDNHDSTYKQSPTHEEKGRYIHRVPDLLVYDNKKELNRIVESPVVSLEKDLLQIVTQASYEPNYKAANYFGRLLEEKPITFINTHRQQLVDTLKKWVPSSTALNSIGNGLLLSREYAKAQLAFEIMTDITPTNVFANTKLGELNMKQGNKTAAKKYYQKVLELHPGDANATNMLQQLN
jgi:tetratricopeptide (TPR) repeat protein